MSVGKVLNIFIVLIGIWEIIAPFALGYPAGTFAFWNTIIMGVLLVILGGVVLLSRDQPINQILDWIVALIGLWLIAAPYILSFSYTSLQLSGDPTIIGVVVTFLGGLAALQFRRPRPYSTHPQAQTAGEPPQPVYGRGQGSQPGVLTEDGRSDLMEPSPAAGEEGQPKPGEPPAAMEPADASGYPIPDDELLNEVVKKLDQNWQLSPSTIHVEVREGVVTLRGELDTAEAKEIALHTAGSVTGVRRVVDELWTPG